MCIITGEDILSATGVSQFSRIIWLYFGSFGLFELELTEDWLREGSFYFSWPLSGDYLNVFGGGSTETSFALDWFEWAKIVFSGIGATVGLDFNFRIVSDYFEIPFIIFLNENRVNILLKIDLTFF